MTIYKYTYNAVYNKLHIVSPFKHSIDILIFIKKSSSLIIQIYEVKFWWFVFHKKGNIFTKYKKKFTHLVKCPLLLWIKLMKFTLKLIKSMTQHRNKENYLLLPLLSIINHSIWKYNSCNFSDQHNVFFPGILM